jgi:hypothetical protein
VSYGPGNNLLQFDGGKTPKVSSKSITKLALARSKVNEDERREGLLKLLYPLHKTALEAAIVFVFSEDGSAFVATCRDMIPAVKRVDSKGSGHRDTLEGKVDTC